MFIVKTNVVIIKDLSNEDYKARNFLQMCCRDCVFYKEIDKFHINILSFINRQCAEDCMAKAKDYSSAQFCWGKEYWMRMGKYDQREGLVTLLFNHIPPTIIVNRDGSYEYKISVRSSRY